MNVRSSCGRGSWKENDADDEKAKHKPLIYVPRTKCNIKISRQQINDL